MRFQHTYIAGLIEIFPRIFQDERGALFEPFKQKLFNTYGIPAVFVQDNQSFSTKGMMRGLHFQKEPFTAWEVVPVWYTCTNVYNKASENGIVGNDPDYIYTEKLLILSFLKKTWCCLLLGKL
jgi:dTDP-4-dehydrorhamnose 3,5-epimerase-like enzyme